MKKLFAIFLLFFSSLAFGGAAVIFNGDFVKTLKENIKIKDTAYIMTGADNPTVVAVDAPKGSLYIRQGVVGELYVKQDDGSSTNWEIAATGADVPVSLASPSTDNAIARYSGTSGTELDESLVLVDDLGNITGVAILTATTVNTTNLNVSSVTADRALISDGSKNVASSTVTSTELGYVSGVTSGIQGQLDNKVELAPTADNVLIRADGVAGQVQGTGIVVDDTTDAMGFPGSAAITGATGASLTATVGTATVSGASGASLSTNNGTVAISSSNGAATVTGNTNATVAATTGTLSLTGNTSATMSATAATVQASSSTATLTSLAGDVDVTAATTLNLSAGTEITADADFNTTGNILMSSSAPLIQLTNTNIPVEGRIALSDFNMDIRTTTNHNLIFGANNTQYLFLRASGRLDIDNLDLVNVSEVLTTDAAGNMATVAQLPTSQGGTGVNSTATFPASGTVATVPGTGVVKSDGSVLSASDVDLTSEVTGALPIGNGGTGQSTKAAAFDALSPGSAKGDIISHDGINNVKLGVGANNKILTADSTTTTGLAYKTDQHTINYVTEPNFYTSPEWTVVGQVGGSNVFTSTLPREVTQKTGIKITRSGAYASTSYGAVCFQIDTVGLNQLQRLSFDYLYQWTAGSVDLELYSYDSSDCTTNETAVTVSQTNLPALTSSFSETFTANSQAYYQLRFVFSSGTVDTDAITLNNLVVGPEVVGNLNVASEYVFNTDTTDADDTSSYGSGATGQAFPTALTATRVKRVQTVRNLTDTDKIALEVSDGNTAWQDAERQFPQISDSGNEYGMWWEWQSANTVEVYFGGDGALADGTQWNDASLSGYKWRLRVDTAGVPTTYALHNASDDGLISPSAQTVYGPKTFDGAVDMSSTLDVVGTTSVESNVHIKNGQGTLSSVYDLTIRDSIPTIALQDTDGTGNTAVATVEFFDSADTRIGYIGDASASNQSIFVVGEQANSYVNLQPGSSAQVNIVRQGTEALPSLILNNDVDSGWYQSGSSNWLFSNDGQLQLGFADDRVALYDASANETLTLDHDGATYEVSANTASACAFATTGSCPGLWINNSGGDSALVFKNDANEAGIFADDSGVDDIYLRFYTTYDGTLSEKFSIGYTANSSLLTMLAPEFADTANSVQSAPSFRGPDADTGLFFSSAGIWGLSSNSVNTINASSTNVVVNDGSVDLNFIVETNNNTQALYVDGGNDDVVINEAGYAETDFRVEADTNTLAFHVDATGAGNVGFDVAAQANIGAKFGSTLNPSVSINTVNGTQRNGWDALEIHTSSNDVSGWFNYDATVDDANTFLFFDYASDATAASGNYLNFYRTGSYQGQIDVQADGTGVDYKTASDERLKTDIEDLTGAIEIIKTIRPRKFRWIEDKERGEMGYDHGFIAQEMMAVYPKPVGDDPNNPYPEHMLGMDYAKITPLLTAALKEAIDRIEVLEQKINALENQ